MELKFIQQQNNHNIAILKEFSYGQFTIKLTINMEGPIEIEAFDNRHDVVIKAINQEKAIVLIEGTCLSTCRRLEELVQSCKEAEELLELINNNRQRIIEEWEE